MVYVTNISGAKARRRAFSSTCMFDTAASSTSNDDRTNTVLERLGKRNNSRVSK